ncbi:MAG: class I SAM-dependent methyltransferase [Candidatus Omnitrophica bacterium]|nr:class I SAM-dependent methyltransferase [Candidatus Omnitrophota bacterium]
MPDTRTLRSFFDAIAKRYDFLNSWLSFCLDKKWRRSSVRLALEGDEDRILDLGMGSGKFLKEFMLKKNFSIAVGLDLSKEMLSYAKTSIDPGVYLTQGDFAHIPFGNDSFDLVISSFTLRSVQDLPGFLHSVYDLLRGNGKAVFLCLTRPGNWMMRMLSYPYLKWYVPFMGGVLSGKRDAYRFLSDSVFLFQKPLETAQMMRRIGFKEVGIHSFSWGIATLLVGKKTIRGRYDGL